MTTAAPARVPFLDLLPAYRELAPELDAAAARVLGSGWYVLGPEVGSIYAAIHRGHLHLLISAK